jgi:hypothetical protein
LAAILKPVLHKVQVSTAVPDANVMQFEPPVYVATQALVVVSITFVAVVQVQSVITLALTADVESVGHATGAIADVDAVPEAQKKLTAQAAHTAVPVAAAVFPAVQTVQTPETKP